MLYSTTMRAVVMPRAAAEARYRKQEKPSVEDLFLGILKLSEMKAEDFLMEADKWKTGIQLMIREELLQRKTLLRESLL